MKPETIHLLKKNTTFIPDLLYKFSLKICFDTRIRDISFMRINTTDLKLHSFCCYITKPSHRIATHRHYQSEETVDAM